MPIVDMPFDWRLCERLLMVLKWRINQVRRDGYMHSARKVVEPPREKIPIVIDIDDIIEKSHT